ncbi:MAG: hypothetical protein J4G05_10170 [Chlorobi bacterium]|nr:hypothetical protein [Chlorobiota bacterium]
MTIRLPLYVSIVGTALFLIADSLAAQVPECSITVVALNGTALRNENSLSVGSSLAKGDVIQVEDGSLLELAVGDGGSAKIGANSKVHVDASYCPNPSSDVVRLRLLSGSLWAKGSPELSKYHISSEHFLVMVGTSTITLNARHLDTTFTLSREFQRIETRYRADTVEVESYTLPFNGDVSTVFALSGDVTMVAWGGKPIVLKEGQQSICGFGESHISSEPRDIDRETLLFDAAGTYRSGN